MKKLRDRNVVFTVFLDGNEEFGTSTVDLPDIEFLSDTMTGAGLAGEIETPALGQIKAMKATLHWRTLYGSSAKLAKQRFHRIECRAAMQEEDTDTGELNTIPVSVQIGGWALKSSLGKFENNKGSDATTEISINSLKVEIGGEEQYNIDILNHIVIIDGVDYWEDIRTALYN